MVATIENVFEPLPIRRRTLVPVEPNQYNVVMGPNETKTIKADTAYQAFKLSGFRHALKIERVSNLAQPLLSEKQFSDITLPATADTVQEEDHTTRRRNLIVSADELDAIMRKLQEVATRVPMPAIVPTTPAPTAEGAVTSPTGRDVHGEGFDEIIPSSPAAKPIIPSKGAEPKEAGKTESQAAIASAAPLPERELSKEEVDKLLGGK